MRYPLEVMLACAHWYAAYPLSLRHFEERMAERGVGADHAAVHRWAIKMLPVRSAAFRRRKRPWASVGAWTEVCHEHKRKLVVLY